MQNFQKRTLSTKKPKPKSEEEDFPPSVINGMILGGVLGSGFSAYFIGKRRFGERDMEYTVTGAVLGGLGGAVAGAVWPASLLCCAAVGTAYAIDNMPVDVTFKKKNSCNE